MSGGFLIIGSQYRKKSKKSKRKKKKGEKAPKRDDVNYNKPSGKTER